MAPVESLCCLFDSTFSLCQMSKSYLERIFFFFFLFSFSLFTTRYCPNRRSLHWSFIATLNSLTFHTLVLGPSRIYPLLSGIGEFRGGWEPWNGRTTHKGVFVRNLCHCHHYYCYHHRYFHKDDPPSSAVLSLSPLYYAIR